MKTLRPDDPAERQRIIDRFDQAFSQFIPHNRALGLSFVDWGDADAWMRLPYAPHLVGNPETGVLHGGAISALLDATCGAAVFMRLEHPVPIATLDLRIDYLRPATPRLDVVAHATCYHLTRNVGFARAFAYQDDESRPVASAAGTFMIKARGPASIKLGKAAL